MIPPNTQVLFTDSRRNIVLGRVVKGPDAVGQYAVEYGLGRWWVFLRERQMSKVHSNVTAMDDEGGIASLLENDYADSDL